MDLNAMIGFSHEIRKRLDYLSNLEVSLKQQINDAEKESVNLIKNNSKDLEKKVNEYFLNQTIPLSGKLINIRSTLRPYSRDYYGKTPNFNNCSLETNKRELEILYEKIQDLCQKMNQLEIKKDTPIESYADQIVPLVIEAEKRIEAIKNQQRSQLNLKQYYDTCERLKADYVNNYANKLNLQFASEVDRLLVKEDTTINHQFFEMLSTEWERNLPNYEEGTDQFNSSYVIGKLQIPFMKDQQSDQRLLAKSPLLQKYVFDGRVKGPFSLNLKNQGNLYIEHNKAETSKMTISFIHEFIQGFLLHQPAGHLNLCLFDFNDECKFNRYMPLKNISEKALFQGVVRNEKNVDSVIHDIEQMMFDTVDNKFSACSASDIFEYNKKSKENPLDLHLMVLLGFPQKYSIEAISNIEKIVSNGNAAGIYTLIVKNNSETVDFGQKQDVYEKLIASIEKNAINLRETDYSYKLSGEYTAQLRDILSKNKEYIYKIGDDGYNAIKCNNQIVPLNTFDRLLEHRTSNQDIRMYENEDKTCTKFMIFRSPFDYSDKLVYSYELNLGGYEFAPNKILASNDFSFRVLPVLEGNNKNVQKAVLPMEDMFAAKREYSLNNGVADDFSKCIEIPIGKDGGEIQSINFSTTGDTAAHALVIGGTGSGKTNLLHTIILSACHRYSPDELSIYLVDFKGGVEFKFYEADKNISRQLPHIALTGLTSEPEDGVAILNNIRNILRERENLFRKKNVSDISKYNETYGKDGILPRLLVIIDEVQELFSNERLAQEAMVILGEIFKKGRVLGISVLWASQTIPRVAGGDFRDKVLSQIGMRVCLKLNIAEEAEMIGISAAKAKTLTKKGYGIIYDGNKYTDVRIAYAEESQNRYRYIEHIKEKWESKSSNISNKRMFIVGDDEIPQAIEGAYKYQPDVMLESSSKSSDKYCLSIGQDYISGKPFEIGLAMVESRENVWITGKDPLAMADMMGYSMLSAWIEHSTNSDLDKDTRKDTMYFFNGEIASKNRAFLGQTVAEECADAFTIISTKDELIDKMFSLYQLRRERYSYSSAVHTPIFVFIQKAQVLAELFSDDKTYSPLGTEEKQDEKTSASPFSLNNFSSISLGNHSSISLGDHSNISIKGATFGAKKGVTFAEIMKELISRGSDVGIHFVISMNDPLAIPELRGEMKGFGYKIVLYGAPNDSVQVLTDKYSNYVPQKEEVAFCHCGTQMNKFKMYRYDAVQDDAWIKQIIKKYT